MSVNKFMHPRNKYRKPPNFKALAAKYPEFQKHVKQDASGKVSLDFKNLKALQALTTTLLKEDFELDVEIPLNRFIPTLPLYMNYLLWIEDIVAANPKTSDIVRGIDIGCGGSCVYPLLAAKQFQWHMLATEVDTASAFTASSNVRKNKLTDKITVRTVKKDTMLQGVLEPGTVYDFCMCNPPSFGSGEEVDGAASGATGELMVIVNTIIRDSLILQETVRAYSVMLAHKGSADKVSALLKDAGITRMTSYQFCQGHTTRWGVAWTLGFTELPVVSHSNKQNIPFSQTVPLDLTKTLERLLQLMAELQITHSTLKSNEELCTMEITAMKNTWSVTKKKNGADQTKSENGDDNKTKIEKTEESDKCEDKSKESEIYQTKNNETEEGSKVIKVEETVNSQNEKGTDEKTAVDGESSESKVQNIGENISCSDSPEMKRSKIENGSLEVNIGPQRGPVLTGSLVVRKSTKGSVVELSWLRGPGGRNSAQQLLQHFIDNIATH